MKNIHAQELQKLSHGIPKVYSEAERELRRQRLAIARSKRAKAGLSPQMKNTTGNKRK